MNLSTSVTITPLFAAYEPFRSATLALVRFGFIEFSSAFGNNIITITERLVDFFDRVDIEKGQP